ncbi:hypothetical protein SJAV_12280 [Sulfurisphaera javensis]|uniref:Uncharacterized protein n=1 Tax=Sulfurisphaera javensis TaxID=2049879 RepID=A0AAT9GRH1_9CREN
MYINAVRLIPNLDVLTVYYVDPSKVPRQDITMIGSKINKSSSSLVATVFTNDYNEDIKAGIYFTSANGELSEQELQQFPEIKDAVKKQYDSNSIIASRLLINKLKKDFRNNEKLRQYECQKKVIGSDLCLEFTHQQAVDLEISDGYFDSFCGKYPCLCGEKKDNLCQVVKRFTFNIMQSEIRDEKLLHLVINLSYGINMELNLEYILSILGKEGKIDSLKGVKVNFLADPNSKNKVYTIERIEENRIVLSSPDDENNQISIPIDPKMWKNKYLIKINPNFKRSRLFIQNNLCKNFDAFRRDLGMLITPRKFYKIMLDEKNLERLSNLLKDLMVIGGVRYDIPTKLEVIE